MDIQLLKHQLFDFIEQSETRLTPRAAEKAVRLETGADRRAIREAIRSLVDESLLTYTYVFGATYLEPSFRRPVRIGNAIVAVPDDLTIEGLSGDVWVRISPGVSFGSGAHPTTRLSVRGIEHVLKERPLIRDFRGSRVLDIGTGSGILAITALKLGIETGIGVDTDPCARREAAGNAALNGLSGRMSVTASSFSIKGEFTLVTANLRLPDILNLRPYISERTASSGIAVISGLRHEETPVVVERYRGGFSSILEMAEKGWACLVFRKTA